MSHWPLGFATLGVWKNFEYRCETFHEALVPWSAKTCSRSCYIIGPTGHGKTVAMQHMGAIDIQEELSTVFLDPFRDFGDSMLEICALAGKSSESIAYFDLGDPKNAQGLNPCVRSNQTPSQTALSILSAISSRWESLGPQTTETLLFALTVLCEAKARLTDIEDLFYSRRVRSALLARCKTKRILDYWRRYDALSAEKQSVLASPITNKLASLLSVESIRNIFGHRHPIDLANHLNTPGSVTVINLRASEFHSASWQAGSLILSAILDEVFSRGNVPESWRNPVRIYCDEFAEFDMTGFERILASGRRFGCSVVLAHQNLNQIDPKMRATILGNVGVKLIFGASYADSQILNKDIAGDPKAFDLTALPPGEAILWRRGYTPEHIEINAPIIKDVGRRSPEASRILDELKKSQRESAHSNTYSFLDTHSMSDDSAPEQPENPKNDDTPDLGDWL